MLAGASSRPNAEPSESLGMRPRDIKNTTTKYIVNYINSRYNTPGNPMKGMNMAITSGIRLKVADEIWIATALLHRGHPDKADFAIEEIMQCATKEAKPEPLRPGVYVHIVQHCVANRPP